jgi:hypothetical protein
LHLRAAAHLNLRLHRRHQECESPAKISTAGRPPRRAPKPAFEVTSALVHETS